MRQDTKPGLINLNLIIDEEVFFSVFGKQDASFNQQLMNFYQLGSAITRSNAPFTGGPWTGPLDAGSSPLPIVVTATLANGAPAYAYPMSNVGVVAADPMLTVAVPPPAFTFGNRMKASFAQFLWLRHGGSGFVFGYGSGTTEQNYAITPPTPPATTPNPPSIPADRPFHSLSYPDLDYTVLRPAALPPSTFTDPVSRPERLPATQVTRA